MPYQSIDRDNVRQYEKTKRTQLICGTVTSGLLILSVAAVAISGHWAEFARKKAARDAEG